MTLDRPQLATSDAPSAGLTDLYQEKPAAYFGNARDDIVARLATDNTSSILEVGCGSGGTGRAALAAGKAGAYVGVEIDAVAAERARGALTEVIHADVEHLDLSGFEDRFDALILSEVLEHLIDPWTTLQRLARCVRRGGRVYASCPNIAHWGSILKIAKGRFDYEDA